MKKSAFLVSCLAVSAVFADVPYQLGVAGYSFHKRTIDDSLAIMQKAGVRNLCVKDFHLKYDSTDAEIAAFKAKCAAFGVTPYALGPLYTKDVETTRAYFAFARRFGAKVIVGVPWEKKDPAGPDSWSNRRGSRALLLEIDKMVREYDIRYAIHNHGPQAGEQFPDVAYGWELVKDLDPRIGFCLDVGWEYGCDRDPAKTIRTFGDRIYDVHFKDFEIGKPNGRSVPLGRGKLDYKSVMQALADVGYAGVCSIEYEKDFEDNSMAIAECAGYFRGMAKCLVARAAMSPVPAGANTLSPAEKAEGWELLFDGRNLPKDKFVGVRSKCTEFPAVGWFVKDGALTMRPQHVIREDGTWGDLPPEDMKLGGAGDIVTVKKYRDFAFRFDFRMTAKANSGVKYFFDETVNSASCEEYQILEPGHPDSEKGRDGNRKIAALYDIYPAPAAAAVAKGVGKWNSGLIVAKGPHVEHWLNGVKVLEYERGSEGFRAKVKESKYVTWGKDAAGNPQPWGEVAAGRILLQDHTDSTVSFCNLKIREL